MAFLQKNPASKSLILCAVLLWSPRCGGLELLSQPLIPINVGFYRRDSLTSDADVLIMFSW
jgi:hypothetical protein